MSLERAKTYLDSCHLLDRVIELEECAHAIGWVDVCKE